MTTDCELAYSTARNFAMKARNEGKSITRELLVECVSKANRFMELGLNSQDLDEIVKQLETALSVTIGKELTLRGRAEHMPWIGQARQELQWRFWSRYKDYQIVSGLPENVVDALDRITDKILGLTGDPRSPQNFDRRGLVVGHVQSGKTANYTGLICKAADAGYKMIIVLAGLHNNLRAQTQVRLEEGFLGYKNVQAKGKVQGQKIPVGVGASGFDELLLANTMTTRLENGDFNKGASKQFSVSPEMTPWLFVIKKQVSVLRNLFQWLENFVPASLPAIVIDDEADNASIDTKVQDFHGDQPDPDHEPTKVNAFIRQILNHFQRKSYVGYTATPFANIFIHHDAETPKVGPDLFPRDFIISLPTPSSYVGPARVFGLSRDTEPDQEQALPLIRKVTDAEDWMPRGHKQTWVPDGLPPSLRRAVLSFCITCACRNLRKPDGINSMLIHVTKLVKVQKVVYDELDSFLRKIRRELTLGSALQQTEVAGQLREIWDEDYLRTWAELKERGLPQEPHTWDAMLGSLVDLMDSIQLKQINGSASDVLDYSTATDGMHVIAVGGDKLSRGLTLEGLSISYFLRPTEMYDSLMQMGRWFGYRPGYLDLCRLYTTHELVHWFEHITVANQELREEFERMVAIGLTPSEYGLRVLSHPSLMVTSTAKMQHGLELELSFAGDVKETVNFELGETLQRNTRAVDSLLRALAAPETLDAQSSGSVTVRWKNTLIWRNCSAEPILTFLNDFATSPLATTAKSDLMASYIQEQMKRGELREWTVALIGGQGQKISIGGHQTTLSIRANKGEVEEGRYRIGRLLSPKDESIDLSEEEFAAVIRDWEKEKPASETGSTSTTPFGRHYRMKRPDRRGLLILYALTTEEGKSPCGPLRSFAGSGTCSRSG
ncbi:MAG: Z1 domain-containing protein [Vulcanimicrobiota bacterium]